MLFTWRHYYAFCVVLINELRLFRCDMETKVIGGSYARSREYPHAVFLHMYCPDDFTCGSSILNHRILITAAHCVYDCSTVMKFDIAAFAGNEDVSKSSIVRKVQKIIHHRKYDEISVENDIALLGVEKSFPLNGHIKRVIIPRKFPDLQTAIVAGWGIIDEVTSEIPIRLKFVTQNLRSKRTCAVIGRLTSSMFCAGSMQFDAPHPAPGDSGSALITSDFIVMGLVSFRMRNMPALMVYTNVSYFYDWISRKSKDLFCKVQD